MAFTAERERRSPRIRKLTVVSNTLITPLMARIVLTGEDLTGFEAPGFDDHIRLFFPADGAPALSKPEIGEKGAVWPDPKPQGRDYTPRAYDAGRNELTLDFVIHPGGVAADWAAIAAPGDTLFIGGPRGSFMIEGAGDWQLLAGDATALPAIARRLESLPDGSNARAVIAVANAGEEQQINAPADVEITWLHADKGETLAGWISDLTFPEGVGFFFFAAEASLSDKAREIAATAPEDQVLARISNYWRA